ncbi:MAG TPA: helix-turn-helix transcriptional regulator, partial [Lachnospiraceae bacterium]
ELSDIYTCIAKGYKNFKKYEQAKIVSNIQGEIIASGEKAYLVTDDFTHVMSYNAIAMEYMKSILGEEIAGQIGSESPCKWLPFLLGEECECQNNGRWGVRTRTIWNYIFKIHTFDQTYSNGIIDRYHWITISKKEQEREEKQGERNSFSLTQSEKKVADLICHGFTYKEIAEKLSISYHTVKKHTQHIYTKCKVNSRYELYKCIEGKEG